MSTHSVAKNNGVILLYHSIAANIPNGLAKTLHNVTPDCFEKHLEDMSSAFKFVSLEEYSGAKSKSGLAAITFDDGYRNVFENALPILESFAYPFTIFLNPLTFERRYSWRDKVRYIIAHQQEGLFCESFNFRYQAGRFYRYSKHPMNNSCDVDQAMDRWIAGHQLDIYDEYPYLQEDDLIIDNDLIGYGNHSQNHYVLSSLDYSQQEFEIYKAHQCLRNIKNRSLSECFAAPFGGTEDLTNSTFQIVSNCGYSSLLMSRQRLQLEQDSQSNVTILERFMPRSTQILNEIIEIS